MKKLNIVTILKSLIMIPSISGDLVMCQKIIEISQSLLNSHKVKSKIISVKKRQILVWGETNLSKSVWLINSHLDVVPGKIDQFKPVEKNGKMLGRGAFDTKSSISILLSNASGWQREAINSHITFMLVTDEEIGGESTKQILNRMKSLGGAIFLEPTDEKIITQAKGIIQIKISAKGVSSHGSRPWKGISALELLTTSLNKFRSKHPIPNQETQNTTFNFSILNSGSVINQIPNEATLWCDVRWNPNDNPKLIINEFKNFFSSAKIEVVKLESPVNCGKDSLICKTLAKACKKNGLSAIERFEHGSSDARHCTAINIPAIVFGPKGENQHADSEWVNLKSLDRISKILDTWISHLN